MLDQNLITEFLRRLLFAQLATYFQTVMQGPGQANSVQMITLNEFVLYGVRRLEKCEEPEVDYTRRIDWQRYRD